MAEFADRIGMATLAVPHLLDIFSALALGSSASFPVKRRSNICKLVLGNERDEVEGIDSHLADLFCNRRDVVLVNAGI